MTDSRFLNALIGALVTLVLSFTGFSPVVGGAVAAWLEEGDERASVRVGALSGAIALLPIFLLVFGLFFGVTGVSVGVFFLVFGIAVFALYVVGLGALGGYLTYYVIKDRRIPGTRE